MNLNKEQFMDTVKKFTDKQSDDLKLIDSMFLQILRINMKLDCISNGRKYLLPDPKFASSINYIQLRGIINLLPLKDQCHLRLINKRFNIIVLKTFEDQIEIMKQQTISIQQQIKDQQENIKNIQQPNLIEEIQTYFNSFWHIIANVDARDLMELKANRNPLVIIIRVLYAAINLIYDDINPLKINTDPKSDNQANWNEILKSMKPSFFSDMIDLRNKILENGLCQFHLKFLNEIQDITAEAGNKVSRFVGSVIAMLKGIEELYKKFDLIQEKGKILDIKKKEVLLNKKIQVLSKIIKN